MQNLYNPMAHHHFGGPMVMGGPMMMGGPFMYDQLQNQLKLEAPMGVKMEFQNQPWIDGLQNQLSISGHGMKLDFMNLYDKCHNHYAKKHHDNKEPDYLMDLYKKHCHEKAKEIVEAAEEEPNYLQNQFTISGHGISASFQNQPWIETNTPYLQNQAMTLDDNGLPVYFQNLWTWSGLKKEAKELVKDTKEKIAEKKEKLKAEIHEATAPKEEAAALQDLFTISGHGISASFQNQPWIETNTPYLQNQAMTLDDFGNPVYFQDLFKISGHGISAEFQNQPWIETGTSYLQNMNAVEDVAHAGAAVAVANAHGLY